MKYEVRPKPIKEIIDMRNPTQNTYVSGSFIIVNPNRCNSNSIGKSRIAIARYNFSFICLFYMFNEFGKYNKVGFFFWISTSG